jgi:MFS family permease
MADFWGGNLVAAPGTVMRPGLVLAVFAGYGVLWGPYLANLPDVRRAAGADEATLGAALLVGGIATVPAILLAGRLLDRSGRPAALAAMVLFAAASPLPALVDGVPGLVLAVGLFGFGSGACNVVVVALAAAAEAGSGRRVMNRAHALFSVGVLAGGLATGALRAAGIPGRDVAVLLGAAVVLAVPALWRGLPRWMSRRREHRGPTRLGRPAALLSLLAALAIALESGVQSWSAVFLADVVRADAGLAALAPGVFAGAMVLGRLGGHWLCGRWSDRTVLLGSGALSGGGVLLLAVAATPGHGLLGMATVGAAIAAVTPTAYARIGRGAPPERRGNVLGSATSIASTGLLVGPVLVGQVAGHTGLRPAVAALSLLSVAVCVLALRVPRGLNAGMTWPASWKAAAERTSSTAERSSG